MEGIQKFDLGSNYTEQKLVKELAELFLLAKDQHVTDPITFYDTFDWRLYKKSLLLTQSGNVFFLRELPGNNIVQRTVISSQPVYAQDFPESPLKTRLEPLLDIRALLKLVDVELNTTTYHILNDDEKTVAWVTFESLQGDVTGNGDTKNGSTLTTHIHLKPVKGYAKYAKSLQRHFETIDLTRTEDNLYLAALTSTGKQPGDYSSKLRFRLDPQMRSDEATKIVLRFLYQVMLQNEEGIKQDIDREFLHDYRVAVRRTRSALGQIKSVFPAEATLRFKEDFAVVGRLTNDLRDLDVYLMAEKSYKAMLPDVLQDDIDPLFDHLKQKRTEALNKVVKELNSKLYAKILHDWEQFLSEPPADAPTAYFAGRPIIDLACERIYKRYRRIVKTGRRLLEGATDNEMHALRVECKKLRYLMEFFASLFPRKDIKYLTKQLKMLQRNLGDFNDFRIQQAYLFSIADELPRGDVESDRVRLAIGSLIGTLHTKKEREKSAFARTFTDFASPANKYLFKELFSVKKNTGTL